MIVTRTIEVPASTTERLVHIVCDMCGTKSSVWGWVRHPGCGEIRDVSVCFDARENGYDGDGPVERLTCDLCPECFQGKLVPWLESCGVKTRLEHIQPERE